MCRATSGYLVTVYMKSGMDVLRDQEGARSIINRAHRILTMGISVRVASKQLHTNHTNYTNSKHGAYVRFNGDEIAISTTHMTHANSGLRAMSVWLE